ncbi:MAG: hypothetical protein ISP90_18480 [Nevskia sp.]|nr:hypothetical protein [Nevskia sp.]
MYPATTANRRKPLLRHALALALVVATAACAYVPRRETATPMSPHEARIFATTTLLHNPVTNRPARFNDYSGQILSVEIAAGRIHIVTANRVVDLALAELQPSSSGTKVYLIPELAVLTSSADAPRLADALFTLKQASIDGVAVD